MEISERTGITGSSRIVCDKVADLHALIQHWNEQVKLGSIYLQSIHNSDLSKENGFNKQLHDKCESLRPTIYEMESIVKNMKTIVNNLIAVTKLEHDNTIIFKTWPVKKFQECCEEIYNAYKDELSVKEMVAESIAHQQNETEGIALQTAWVYEPLITINIKITLENMLLETGHRNIKG